MTDDHFFAVLTSKRDEGLAHLTDMIERSGVDEFCEFLVSDIMPLIVDNSKSHGGDATQFVIGCMAIVGAVDALLAHRDKQSNAEGGEL